MQLTDNKAAILILEDGSIFHGESVGMVGQVVGEVVFNTAMTGYQEILTDPSYASQIVTLTYPHVGNVGTNWEDQESQCVWAAGLVIRDLPLLPSNWRAESSLSDYLQLNKVVAITNVDTRRLTRLLREKGALRGCIMSGEINLQTAKNAILAFPGLEGLDLASQVSTRIIYRWLQSVWSYDVGYREALKTNLEYHVVAYDFGVKHNILRLLVDRGCHVTVVPAKTPASEILALRPNGIFLSNGPGDPAACKYAIEAVRELLMTPIPLFGICLGFQILALACGAKTVKMKFGHHGANHPVQNVFNKKVFITSQNHGFAVNEDDLPDELEVTHYSLFDGTIQGIRHRDKLAFGFQGHPEASPGPHDIQVMFDEFIELMKN